MKLSGRTFSKPAFVSIYLCLLLLWSLMANAVSVSQKPGVVIPDATPYPFYKYSKIELSEPEQALSLHLNISGRQPKTLLIAILENLGIPLEYAVDSDEIKTGWISWHYDKESRQSQSRFRNNFFRQKFKDRYRFEFVIFVSENHSDIRLTKVERSEEKDITPDSEYTWTQWQDEQPDERAVHDFLQRLQTEFERLMLSKKSEPAPVVSAPVQKPGANHIQLNKPVASAWNSLIKVLSTQSIRLKSSHNEQHMLYTDWVYAEYNATKQTLTHLSNSQQRHQFQIIVVPGSVPGSSGLYVYHTAFQQLAKSKWKSVDTSESVAAAFLSELKLDRP